ncbi:MAG: class I SAM-dependent methyltransferase [Treponema sp.]|nr:class I SAM-dependent methyltransferase [Treponema sp.]
MSSAPVLLVPACEAGQGGGHLNRCLFVLRELEARGRETFIWIPEHHKDNVFLRFRNFFEDSNFSKGFHARLLSRKADLSGREWDFIVLDRFRTPAAEFRFWHKIGSLVGIDEGGCCRNRFEFLLDLLPGIKGQPPNLSVPSLLPLPKKRRPSPSPSPAENSDPLRVLISFGAEPAAEPQQGRSSRAAGLGFLAARALAGNALAKNALAKNVQTKTSPPEITLIAPNWDYAGKKHRQLAGIHVIQGLANLKERMAEYDLFITHFGIGAFEAVYARLPVLLISPTAYHEKLSRNAGFFSLGVGAKAASRLDSFTIRQEFLKTLGGRGMKIARRFGLEDEQQEHLGAFLGRLAPRSPRNCPACEEKADAQPALSRFPEETYRRCKHCGIIYLSRLNPPPIEYGNDYFFEFYKKQYGKTYLEDFPNLKEMGKKRLKHITAVLNCSKNLTTNFTNLHNGATGNSEPLPSLFDIGCAYGPFLSAAAECGFSPYGVEPAEDAARYVKEELGFPAWQGFFPTGAKAEDGPFHAVTMWYVLEHFEDPGNILREICRILRNGGVLAFSTPSSSGISGRKNMQMFLKNSPADHWTVWSPRSCKKVLARYGFRLRKIVVTGHHPERFPLLGRFVSPGRKGLLYRLLFFASRIFRLGDTFEAYAVKEQS